MNTETFTATEVDALRAEITELQATVSELQSQIEDIDDGDADRWAIWPYSWVVSGWEKTQRRLNALQSGSSHQLTKLKQENSGSFHCYEPSLKS